MGNKIAITRGSKTKPYPSWAVGSLKTLKGKRRSEKQNFFKRIIVYELRLELSVEMSQGGGFTVTALA